MVGTVRFSPEPDEERLAELEGLRDYLKEGVQKWDAAVEKIKTQGVQKLKRVLGSSTPKETLLEMASNNEIDVGFITLLTTNINSAREAGQERAAEAMEKLRKMALRFVAAEVEAMEAHNSEHSETDVEGPSEGGVEAGEGGAPVSDGPVVIDVAAAPSKDLQAAA